MYYKKNDSRMGDEILGVGLLLAPFAWKLVKKGEAMVHTKIAKFKALSLEEQAKIKFKVFLRGEIIFKCLIVVRFILAIFTLIDGDFSFGDVTSIISYFIVYFIMRVGKKKYEAYA